MQQARQAKPHTTPTHYRLVISISGSTESFPFNSYLRRVSRSLTTLNKAAVSAGCDTYYEHVKFDLFLKNSGRHTFTLHRL